MRLACACALVISRVYSVQETRVLNLPNLSELICESQDTKSMDVKMCVCVWAHARGDMYVCIWGKTDVFGANECEHNRVGNI